MAPQVTRNQRMIKIEANNVIRGSILPPNREELALAAVKELEKEAVMRILSPPDLYGGKICAALDRQHPRDLFDIKLMLENEGLTEKIRQAFIVYLISHPRPMAELLAPNELDIASIFENEFQGMTRISMTLGELSEARRTLVKKIQASLTEEERNFILSVKLGEPEWSLMPFEHIHQLPAVQWKLANIAKMPRDKHKKAVDKLKRALGVIRPG